MKKAKKEKNILFFTLDMSNVSMRPSKNARHWEGVPDYKKIGCERDQGS